MCMKEDYVNFEIAKLLKEKGFDWEVHRSYLVNDNVFIPGDINDVPLRKDAIRIPSLQMTMKWLREVHNLFIQITIIPHTTVTMEQKYYLFSVHKNRRNLVNRNDHPHDCYSTYEEACEAAIKYCLEKLI